MGIPRKNGCRGSIKALSPPANYVPYGPKGALAKRHPRTRYRRQRREVSPWENLTLSKFVPPKVDNFRCLGQLVLVCRK
jgi:hypothetical protein